MSASNNIGGSFTIIPQSVHKILTDSYDGKEVRANNEPVFKGTFAEKQGAVLNDLKRLSYAKKVTWNDTGGKTGFSGFLKVVGNILHNFRSHFYSSEKALAHLERDIQTLEKFGTSEKMTASEYEQLKGFLTEIKQINKDNEFSRQNLKANVSECLNKYDKPLSEDPNRHVAIQTLKGMIDHWLSKQGALGQCIEMFVKLNPSEEDVAKFSENLKLQWQTDPSLGDRLERILEDQAKVYEELHQKT